MTVLSAIAMDWATTFGIVTLLCWMAAGFAAVFGTVEEIRHADAGKLSGYVTSGLMAAGLTAAIAMGSILIFAA